MYLIQTTNYCDVNMIVLTITIIYHESWFINYTFFFFFSVVLIVLKRWPQNFWSIEEKNVVEDYFKTLFSDKRYFTACFLYNIFVFSCEKIYTYSDSSKDTKVSLNSKRFRCRSFFSGIVILWYWNLSIIIRKYKRSVRTIVFSNDQTKFLINCCQLR